MAPKQLKLMGGGYIPPPTPVNKGLKAWRYITYVIPRNDTAISRVLRRSDGSFGEEQQEVLNRAEGQVEIFFSHIHNFTLPTSNFLINHLFFSWTPIGCPAL